MDTLTRVVDIAIDVAFYIAVHLCVAALWLRFIALPLTSELLERQAALNQDAIVFDGMPIDLDGSTERISDPERLGRRHCGTLSWALKPTDDLSR